VGGREKGVRGTPRDVHQVSDERYTSTVVDCVGGEARPGKGTKGEEVVVSEYEIGVEERLNST